MIYTIVKIVITNTVKTTNKQNSSKKTNKPEFKQSSRTFETFQTSCSRNILKRPLTSLKPYLNRQEEGISQPRCHLWKNVLNLFRELWASKIPEAHNTVQFSKADFFFFFSFNLGFVYKIFNKGNFWIKFSFVLMNFFLIKHSYIKL